MIVVFSILYLDLVFRTFIALTLFLTALNISIAFSKGKRKNAADNGKKTRLKMDENENI